MKERTGKATVPQIFFNAVHIGGNSDLEKLVNCCFYYVSHIKHARPTGMRSVMLLEISKISTFSKAYGVVTFGTGKNEHFYKI